MCPCTYTVPVERAASRVLIPAGGNLFSFFWEKNQINFFKEKSPFFLIRIKKMSQLYKNFFLEKLKMSQLCFKPSLHHVNICRTKRFNNLLIPSLTKKLKWQLLNKAMYHVLSKFVLFKYFKTELVFLLF